MIQKLSYLDDKDFEKPCWIDELGGSKLMPMPYMEVSEGEFLYGLNQSRPSFFDSRQLFFEDKHATTWIFWGFLNGYAMMFPRKWSAISTLDGRSPTAYTESPRYFILGCDHKFGEDSSRRQFMHEHNYACKKCGVKYSVDSSG